MILVEKTMKNNRKFVVQIEITPDCEEDLTKEDIHKWVENIFFGCDVGEVIVSNVTEKNVK